MYISKVHIQNYKSIKDAEIEFNDKLNIFVGKNGAGKTAVFEAIKKLIFKMPYDSFPDYVSLEICDEKQELGNHIFEAIKNSDVPLGYMPYFQNSLIPNENGDMFKIMLVGERKNNKNIEFYLKYENLFLKDIYICLNKDIFLLPKPNRKNILIQTIERQNIGENIKTISEFIDKALKTEDKDFTIINLPLNLEGIIFDFLQKQCFFVIEMRDLQEKNTKGVFDTQKSNDNDPSYQNSLNSTIAPTTFIDQLHSLQNTKSIDDINIVNSFRQKCEESDGYEVSAIDEKPNGVVLRISKKDNKGKTILVLDNKTFPSGYLQKIFFNFVLAISKDGILFFEEPENNLHPGLQKHVFHLLKERRNL